MGYLNKEEFVCIDCETTGLNAKEDRIIEIAICRFRFDSILESFETLIDPQIPIPTHTTAIHHIHDEMVKGKPLISDVLPQIEKMAADLIIVGHGVSFDVDIIVESAIRSGQVSSLKQNALIDTLRLARYYGNAEINSLQALRAHFQVEQQTAHRAMGDVLVNIDVFKKLVANFKTTKEIFSLLAKPIKLQVMPLGKYRGRAFADIPEKYLRWAAHQKFDLDLLYSIRLELGKRKKGASFNQAANPFKQMLDI